MKSKIILGFIIGLIIPASILALYYKFSYLKQNDILNEAKIAQNNNLYGPYLACKKIENLDKDFSYDTAITVFKENHDKNYSANFLAKEDELIANRVESLKNKCQNELPEKLAKDPYLLGSGTYPACERTAYNNCNTCDMENRATCKKNIEDACKNPKETITTLTQNEFTEQICNTRTVIYNSSYRTNKPYLDRGQLPPAAIIKSFSIKGVLNAALNLSAIVILNTTYILKIDVIYNKLTAYVLSYFTFFIIFLLPEIIGAYVGYKIGKRTLEKT